MIHVLFLLQQVRSKEHFKFLKFTEAYLDTGGIPKALLM